MTRTVVLFLIELHLSSPSAVIILSYLEILTFMFAPPRRLKAINAVIPIFLLVIDPFENELF